MKTTKKRTLAAIIAILGIVGGFAACDNGNDPEPPPPPQTVATPTATPASGEVADNTAVTLATTTAGAAIHYTQDGTEPTAASALYSDTDKPVVTTGKLTLKAIAVKSGLNNSAILTATYTIATVTPPEPTPPTASITNNNQTVTLAPELEITLNGTATKGTNEIHSYEWTLKSATVEGVTPVFTSGTTLATKIKGIKKAGTYVFELKVKDTADLEGKAEATVEVNGYQVTYDEVVEFVPLADSSSGIPSTFAVYTIDFSPSAALPTGITYIITNDKTNKTWNNVGTVSASDFNFKTPPDYWYYLTFTQIFYLNGVEITGTNSKRIVRTCVDNFTDEADFSQFTDTGSVTLTLTKTITEILPPPVTKTVTVTFPAFVEWYPTLNLTPTYMPADGWGDFSASDITYTISDNKGHSNLGNIINASSYVDSDIITFTMTFTQGSMIKRQSFVSDVGNSSGLKFFGIYDNDTDLNDLGTTIPPVTLTLTKPGTW
jgi:hypothetical protein